jgi:hypothetical protein
VFLVGYKVLPQSAKGGPSVQLLNSSDETLGFTPVRICNGSECTLVIKYTVPSAYVGFLGRWLILTFVRRRKATSFSVDQTTFLTAVRLKGCIIADEAPIQLSSEARPFMPLSAILYFDSPVRISLLLFYTLRDFTTLPLTV